MTVLASYWTRMADKLNDVRMQICYYGAYENQTCDCKFGIDNTTKLGLDEMNGCPELRELIRIYRNQVNSVSQSA